MSYWRGCEGGGGGGQMEGVDHVFSNHRIFKCSGLTEGRRPILFDQSNTEQIVQNLENCFL